LQSLATVEEITIVATASNIGTDSFKVAFVFPSFVGQTLTGNANF